MSTGLRRLPPARALCRMASRRRRASARAASRVPDVGTPSESSTTTGRAPGRSTARSSAAAARPSALPAKVPPWMAPSGSGRIIVDIGSRWPTTAASGTPLLIAFEIVVRSGSTP